MPYHGILGEYPLMAQKMMQKGDWHLAANLYALASGYSNSIEDRNTLGELASPLLEKRGRSQSGGGPFWESMDLNERAVLCWEQAADLMRRRKTGFISRPEILLPRFAPLLAAGAV